MNHGEKIPEYELGRYSINPPMPPVPEHCVTFDAGPLRFVVESRQLTDEIARARGLQHDATLPTGIDDFGASLHIYGESDGLEHLRFDCFAHDPHYHYIRNAEGGHVVCRLDDHAEGDPIEWTLERLRRRLPEMLEFAGVGGLASDVRARRSDLLDVIDRLEEVLRRAQRAASDERIARYLI